MGDKGYEIKVIGLVGEINANHRECLRAGNEAIQHALEAGRLLSKAKAEIPHGEWEKWVGQKCDFPERTARWYMKTWRDCEAIPKRQRAAVLKEAESLRSLDKTISELKAKSKPAQPEPSAADFRHDDVQTIDVIPDSDLVEEVESDAASETPQEPAPEKPQPVVNRPRQLLEKLIEAIPPHVLTLYRDMLQELYRDLGGETLPTPKRFVPPTAQQVADYADKIGYKLDAEGFVDFYEQKGWYAGKVKMKSWEAALRNWKRNEWGKKTRGRSTPTLPEEDDESSGV